MKNQEMYITAKKSVSSEISYWTSSPGNQFSRLFSSEILFLVDMYYIYFSCSYFIEDEVVPFEYVRDQITRHFYWHRHFSIESVQVRVEIECVKKIKINKNLTWIVFTQARLLKSKINKLWQNWFELRIQILTEKLIRITNPRFWI